MQINCDLIIADIHFQNLLGYIIENNLVDKSSQNFDKFNKTNKTSGARCVVQSKIIDAILTVNFSPITYIYSCT